jgi:hypothetical protein
MANPSSASVHRRERAVNRRVQGDIGELSAMEWLTSKGGESWSGLAKKFDPNRVDHLFVLVGDGRRWFIPSPMVEGSRSVALEGRKYSEFEIEAGTPFEAAIYGNAKANTIAGVPPLPGECQSGQMDLTVNQAAMPTQVRILPPPSTPTTRQILLRPKRQATFPKAPCEEAGIAAGDRLRVQVDGPGRIVFEKIDGEPPV